MAFAALVTVMSNRFELSASWLKSMVVPWTDFGKTFSEGRNGGKTFSLLKPTKFFSEQLFVLCNKIVTHRLEFWVFARFEHWTVIIL